jgi:5,10-methylenetetrahydromethanopterin reductase
MGTGAFGVELYGYVAAPTLLAEIQAAERLGFASVWLGDSQLIWRDLWVMLGAAAATTSRVALATGVTNPVTRHPAVTASALMTLQELSRGRAVLGVGVGFTALRMLGRPAATRAELRRFVQVARALCRGERVEGEDGAIRLTFGTPAACPPVVIPASGPKMLRLAGEIGDGVILQGCPFGGDVLAAMQARVRGGREAAGRLDAPFRTYFSAPAAVDGDWRAALAAVKAHVAVSLLSPRWPVSAAAQAAATAVRAEYDAYEHMSADANARFAAAVPDAVAAEFSLAGTPAECVAHARALFAGGVDEITIRPYGAHGASRIAAMETFARQVMVPALQGQ